ncbi:MAG: hypothetical protein KAT68_17270 [Bacteroidales bacterium]|nr:hypothetical protein [Bacteroidales bacterium]
MATYIKKGVWGFNQLHPVLSKCFGWIERHYEKRGKDCKITSVAEGNHTTGSLHYIFRAIDFANLEEVFGTIRTIINNFCNKYGIPKHHFDLVYYEDLKIFHLEYDVVK